MKYDELLHAVEQVKQVDSTEEEIAYTVNMLRMELPHAKIINLLFHDFRGLTPQQVVDEAPETGGGICSAEWQDLNLFNLVFVTGK